jgi:poly-gamma-glutamate capsule biosynthesis protein CapA/YwtB (metallophosphatase superfamily)
MNQIKSADSITLFPWGDVMTGRGIDQILPHPGDLFIPEFFMEDASGYVELAVAAHGTIPSPVDFSHVWGDALAEWDRMMPSTAIQMKKAAQELRFEDAARWRDRLALLKQMELEIKPPYEALLEKEELRPLPRKTARIPRHHG